MKEFEKGAEEGTQDYTVRQIRVSDIEQVVGIYKDRYRIGRGGNYIAKGFIDEQAALRAIQEQRYYWLVAEKRGEVVGSTALVPRGRDKYEIGRTVVSASTEGAKIAQTICAQVIQYAFVTLEADLVYATMRNRAIVEVSKHDRLAIVGVSPTHRMVGRRETHLLGYRLSHEGAAKRRRAPVASLYEGDVVLRVESAIEQMSGVSMSREEAEYPASVLASEVRDGDVVLFSYNFLDHTLVLEAGTLGDIVAGLDDPASLVGRLRAGGIQRSQGDIEARCATPPDDNVLLVGMDEQRLVVEEQALRRVEEYLEESPLPVSYVEATVLADKKEVMAQLVKQGMEVLAFLPAWLKEDNAGLRYDAVLLGKVLGSSHTNNLEVEVGEWRRQLRADLGNFLMS